MTQDIDCASFDAGDGGGFDPVGHYTYEERFFGSFDGDGHRILNLTVDRPTENNGALFGTTRDAVITRVGLVNVSITSGDKTAALVGLMDGGSVTECFAEGEVTGAWATGGLVAYAYYATITDSYADVDVDGASDVGVAVGIIDTSTVTRVYGSGASTNSTPAPATGFEYIATTSGFYFDCDVAGLCSDTYAASTTNLQTQSFLSTASYNFMSVWGYRGASTYACLLWEPGCGGSCGSDDATCDGVDDDCDSSVDEDYAAVATSCGVGACASTGNTSCVAGAVEDSCTGGTAATDDATCDGVDDDCDGNTDEDYASVATSCGVGACAASGATSCVAGAVEDSCTAGTGSASDASCDGVDDDCDGASDEDYASTSTSCGVGACAASGSTSCVAGSVTDSCTAGSGAANDLTCDDVDDDCDGVSDEDYASVATSCGAGACGATGSTSCVAGSVADSCTAGTGAPSDPTCDGVDDDCDGVSDEDYAPVVTGCGIGACTAVGATSCVGGSVANSCSPGTGAANDPSCDGVDDDCDGSSDEDYVPIATSCGVGSCFATGATFCAMGSALDSCSPGTPAASDVTCDGADDDCDAALDEDFAVYCSGTAVVSCDAGSEVPTDCDDADACNGDETCGSGACSSGTPPTLDDGNPCTADACDAVSGVSHTPLGDGTSCADGDVCNGDETCGAGVCEAGVSPTVDDGYPCTTDSCDPALGVLHEPLPSGTSCADGDPCDGAETCNAGGVCVAGLPPTTGACVPGAPTAAFYVPHEIDLSMPGTGTTVFDFEGSTTAPDLGYAGGGLTWSSTVGAAGPEFTLEFTGQRSVDDVQLIDRVSLQPEALYGVRTFEIWTSTTGGDPADFSLAFTGETPDANATDLSFDIPLTPARFLRFVMVDNHGGSFTRVRNLRIFTAARGGSLLSLSSAGTVVSASGGAATVDLVHDYVHDAPYVTDTGWVGDPPPQNLDFDLPGTRPILVDALSVRPGENTQSVRDVQVWASASGAEVDLVLVAAGEVENIPYRRGWFFFPPVAARLVRVVAISNNGSTYTRIEDIQVHAADRGGLTATFQDDSIEGGDPIEAWRWDFGDGSTSTQQHPTHVFPGPGSYLVTLQTIGTYGSTGVAQRIYEALPPPQAFFTFDSNPIVAGDSTTAREGSVSDAALEALVWREADGTETTSTPSFPDLSYGFGDPGDYPLRLTAVDAFGVRGSFEALLHVDNRPPTGEIGDDQTVVWGQDLTLDETPSVVEESPSELNDLECRWDFGDGSPDRVIAPCENFGVPVAAALNVTHAYADPGDYELLFSVTDPNGGVGTDAIRVAVIRRESGLVFEAVEGAALGGPLPVRAQLFDRFDASEPMAGRTITFQLGSETQSATTDATGVAETTLTFPAGTTSIVTATFAGDSHYFASDTSVAAPEETRPIRPDNCGREFIFTFPEALDEGREDGRNPWVFVRGERHGPVRVEIPGLGFEASAEVVPGETTTIPLPEAVLDHATGAIELGAVRVSSPDVVCVQGSVHALFSTDGFLALPVVGLGTDHVVGSYGTHVFSTDSSMTITASEDATTVTITPRAELEVGPDTPTGSYLPAGVPFVVTLDRMESIELRAAVTGLRPDEEQDVTGTRIVADRPVSVLGGHACVRIPFTLQACDYLVEQMPSVDKLGSDFYVAPLEGRVGYVVKVVATEDATEVRVDGALVDTLDDGETYQYIGTVEDTALHITTTEPVLALQFGQSTQADNRIGDPMMMLLIPTEQFDDRIAFTTVPEVAHPFTDYLNVVVASSEAGGLRLDGGTIATSFTAIGSTGYSYAAVPVDPGSHSLVHLTPGVGFAAYAYGWATDDSYGYPASLRLVPLDGGCTATTTVAGDGVDNDCDGTYDEEIANGLDDDGDGLVDEDLEFGGSTPVNVAPVAYDGANSIREDTNLSIVLRAFDANLDALTYELVSGPSDGALTGTMPSLTYTPTADFVGVDTFTFRVSDGALTSAAATFTVTVTSENDPPTIPERPVIFAREYEALVIPGDASDLDDEPGCALTWELVSGPPGMTIDAATGDIFWVPDVDGTIPFTVRVTDCHGASAESTFGIELDNVPEPPVIISRPVNRAGIGNTYLYDVDAIDPDTTLPSGTVDSYVLLTSPPGMAIDASTGMISWAPVAADEGTHVVEVIAIDGTGLQSNPQRYSLVVAGDGAAPQVFIEVEPYFVLPGETATIRVTAIDDDAAIIDVVTVDGTAVTLDGAGETTFTASSAGVVPIYAEAVDPSGNRGSASDALRVLDTSDDTPPVVTLTAPAGVGEEDAELNYLHDVVGSVSDTNLHRWTVDLRPTDHGAYRTLLYGDANVSGTLGELDATQLENGRYTLRLRGEDVNGQIGEVTIPVRVTGEAKLGVVQLAFTDLVIEDIGIPIAVTRTYDSRRANAGDIGDFGAGWDLDVRAGRVQANRPLGLDIRITNPELSLLGGVIDPCTLVEEEQYHFVEVRLSDSEQYVFKPDIINTQPVSGGCTGEYQFEFVDGTRPNAELIPFGNTLVRSSQVGAIVDGEFTVQGQLTDIASGSIYAPRNFRLRLEDGRVIDLSIDTGVTRFEDRNGNSLSINPEGLVHSSGRYIAFERDARGRIAAVQDGAGRRVSYGYDASNNLVGVTNTLVQTTEHEYRSSAYPHHLTDIIDYRGVRTAAFEYDPDGRLGELCDADGVCLRQEYDLPGTEMVRLDGLGVPTRYIYEGGSGRVSQTIDGEGGVTYYSYNGSQLAGVTDPVGNATTATYSYPAKLLIARTEPHGAADDPEDYTTHFEWTGPDMTARVLPTGARFEFEYDANHNPTRTADQDDNTIFARSYDGQGRLTSFTDRTGTTTYSYASTTDAKATTIVDGHGTQFDLTYDARGLLTQLVETLGTSEPITHRYRYDDLGRRIFADYGDGVTVTFAYESDRPDWTRISGPTFGEVSRRFSGAGRLISFTDEHGDTTRRVYDAVGRLREEEDPAGVIRNYEYDAAGRMLTIEDESTGGITEYTRDLAGRVTATEDAAGESTSTEYGDDGQVSARVDALARRTEMGELLGDSTTLDPLGITRTQLATDYGLPASTALTDGTTTLTQSTAHLGQTLLDGSDSRPTSRTDEAGRARASTYDARSGLETASDLASAAWGYDYTLVRGRDVRWDIQGGRVWLAGGDGRDPYEYNAGQEDPERDAVDSEERSAFSYVLSSVTSPEGETTSWDYDATGEVDSVTLPTGGVETRTHDAAGRVLTRTTAFGTTFTNTYDVAGRLLQQATDDGEGPSTVTYGPGGRRETATNDAGTLTYSYDAASRMSGLTDVHGHEVSYDHDVLGRTTAVSVREDSSAAWERTEYGYDAAGNVTTITEADSDVVTLAYDAGDRLETRTLPNGVVSRWEYDLAGRVTRVSHETGAGVFASRDYTRLPSGEPLRIDRFDGGPHGTARVLTLDAAARIATENIDDGAGGVNTARRYAYDDDGNRLLRVLDEGTAGEVSESSTIAAGSELASIARTGASTASDAYTYDDAGRTTQIVRGGVTYDLVYDAYDALVRVDRDGVLAYSAEFDGEGRRTTTREHGGATTERRWLIAPSMGEGYESPHLVTDELGAVQASYVYAGEHALSRTDASGTLYYLRDAVGSVIATVDDTGAVVDRYDYDAFGNAIGASALSSVTAGDFRFQGMWLDAGVLGDAGLYFVRARVYDTATGRFTTRDPAEGRQQTPESYWAYAFANGNPEWWRDPSGRISLGNKLAALTVAAILGAVAINQISNTISNAQFEESDVGEAQDYLYLEGGLFSGEHSSSIDGETLGLHRSIGAGHPSRDAYTTSYMSLNGLCGAFSGEGVVYRDVHGGGNVERAIRITPTQRDEIRAYLDAQFQSRGTYSLFGNTCRTWTDSQWRYIVRHWQLELDAGGD